MLAAYLLLKEVGSGISFSFLCFFLPPIVLPCFCKPHLAYTAVTGMRLTVDLIRDLLWKPFDMRFLGLLDRLHDHQELFEIELRIENYKALDEFMYNTEMRLGGAKLSLQGGMKTLQDEDRRQGEWNEREILSMFS